jgi:hypothetical protein
MKMENEVKYPNIKVKLVGTDGNAFALIGKVKQALRDKKVPVEEQKKFVEEAMSGDYDHLLATCCEWVNVR